MTSCPIDTMPKHKNVVFVDIGNVTTIGAKSDGIVVHTDSLFTSVVFNFFNNKRELLNCLTDGA